MKFKKLRKILPSGQVKIDVVSECDTHTTVNNITYDTIFDVPNKYNNCKVVSMNHKCCSFSTITVITIRDNKTPKPIKFGDLRNCIPPFTQISINVKKDNVMIDDAMIDDEYRSIIDVPTEYDDMFVKCVEGKTFDFSMDIASIYGIRVSLDDTK